MLSIFAVANSSSCHPKNEHEQGNEGISEIVY